MGADEEGTLARLKAYRRELIDPKLAEHRGRIVKTTGDGISRPRPKGQRCRLATVPHAGDRPSPDALDAVAVEQALVRHQRAALDFRLGDQHAVEGVLVDLGQASGALAMTQGHGHCPRTLRADVAVMSSARSVANGTSLATGVWPRAIGFDSSVLALWMVTASVWYSLDHQLS
jgi:hypothetical protein